MKTNDNLAYDERISEKPYASDVLQSWHIDGILLKMSR